jgi:hypothetical protein
LVHFGAAVSPAAPCAVTSTWRDAASSTK